MPDITYTLTFAQRSNLDSRLQTIQEITESLESNCESSQDIERLKAETQSCLDIIESLTENE